MSVIDIPVDLRVAGTTLVYQSRRQVPGPSRTSVMAATRDTVSGDQPGRHDQSERWKQLMLAVQAGDQRQYAVFLKEAAAFIRIIARRHHRHSGLVEDVVQETLTSIHRMRHTYEPGRPVEPWVAAIAKARSIDALRKHGRVARRETMEESAALEAHPDQRSTAEARLSSESVIADAMAALTAPQREAIRLLKIEELSLAEAANVSGLSVQALKSALHRAMQSLRARLTGGLDE